MTVEGRAALADHVRAVTEVSRGIVEALEMLGAAIPDATAFGAYTATQRVASRALVKGVEQLQDLIARMMRLVLTLEDEDIVGLSARAIADRAETIGLIASSDAWSALVKLRNRLAHEYPLSESERHARFRDAWTAVASLRGVAADIESFLRRNGYQTDV